MTAAGVDLADMQRAKVALGEWLALTPAGRQRAGLPATQGEFAEQWGIAARTVIRWKQDDPVVAEAYSRAKDRLQGGLHDPAAAPSRDAPAKSQGAPPPGFLGPRRGEQPPVELLESWPLDGLDPATAEFEQIRKKLSKDALTGEPKAVDLYMRYFGKDVIAEQRAQRDSTFTDLSDEQLVGEILGLIGREAVEKWFAGTSGNGAQR